MAKKTNPTGNQVDQVELTAEQKHLREKFIRSLQRRLQDKNWYEISAGIVWAIEQIMSGDPQPDPDPVYEAPKVSGQVSVDMNAVELAIRNILDERDAQRNTSPE